jgi:hypothetical protein
LSDGPPFVDAIGIFILYTIALVRCSRARRMRAANKSRIGNAACSNLARRPRDMFICAVQILQGQASAR